MKNIFILLAAFFLISCATTQGSKRVSTGSMCLDGLHANMIEAGCNKIATKQIHPFVVEISCSEFSEKNISKWLTDRFVAVKQRSTMHRQWEPLCGDPSVILAVRHDL